MNTENAEMSAPVEPIVMQHVFNWRLTMTGPDELTYEGEYMGCRVGLLVETTRRGGNKQHYQFSRQHKHRCVRYETADELLASFPKLHASESRKS